MGNVRWTEVQSKGEGMGAVLSEGWGRNAQTPDAPTRSWISVLE